LEAIVLCCVELAETQGHRVDAIEHPSADVIRADLSSVLRPWREGFCAFVVVGCRNTRAVAFCRSRSYGTVAYGGAYQWRPTDWLAIDDDYLGWPAWCKKRLVLTDEVLGIRAPAVLEEWCAKLAAGDEG
jgi:hypothetical protein